MRATNNSNPREDSADLFPIAKIYRTEMLCIGGFSFSFFHSEYRTYIK